MFPQSLNVMRAFVLLSIAHMATFALSMYVLLPLQAEYTPRLASYASLLFLPHGVRVLGAWLLGWKVIPLFIPTAVFTHSLNFGLDGFTLIGLAGMLSGTVCAALTFWALSFVGMDFRLSSDKQANWRDVMIAGCIASTINTFGMGYAFNHNTATLAGYFIGDVSGTFACIFVLMLFFKLLRENSHSEI